MTWTSIRAEALELGEAFPVAQPAFVAALYGGGEVNAAGPAVFDAWLALLPPKTPLYCLSKSSRRFRKLAAAGLRSVRTALARLEQEGQFYMFQDVDGPRVGDYCLELNMGMKADAATPNRIHASFPADYPDRLGPDAVIDAFRALAASAPFEHGKAGYGFSLAWGREWEQVAMPVIMAAGRRYLALDVRERFTESVLKGKVKGPGWLTYLRSDLWDQLGAEPALQAVGGDKVDVIGCPGGVLLRAGERPPVGDSNRRALDIGPLRKVDRFLKPVRLERWIITELFRVDPDLGNAWFERLER